MTATTTNPIATLRDRLAAALLGREREAEIIILGMIAREHALLVGPPGTGKSAICRYAWQLVADAKYCERLLSPTTPPEAVWGPISLSALRNDRYEHVTTGYAADAHGLFLDEVGRASPAILDTTLHLLGPERQALIGSAQIKVPLVSAIGSANTWPEDAALLDRWALRATVQPIAAAQRRALLTFVQPIASPVATLDDLVAANKTAGMLSVDSATYDKLEELLERLDEVGITVSDRRLRTAEKIARAACVLRGGTTVEPIDLEALQYVLWTQPDHAAQAASIVVAFANPIGARLDAMLGEVDEITKGITDKPSQIAAATKLGELLKEADTWLEDGDASSVRAQKVHAYVTREHMKVSAQILGLSPEKILNAGASFGEMLAAQRKAGLVQKKG